MICNASNLFSKNQKEKGISIGISKIVSHPALDAIEKGIIDTIKKEYPDASYNFV